MTRAWRQDLAGRVFGRLTVTAEAPKRGAERYWIVECACGGRKEVSHKHLKSGGASSCGCWRREVTAARLTKHGGARRGAVSRTFLVWCGIKARCEIPSATGYVYYGARGIRVCQRWQQFENFLADMGDAPDGLEIDRKDSNGHYEPGNCRWVTRAVNADNKRNANKIEFDGAKLSVAAWARHLGINVSSLYERLKKWPLERALTESKGGQK